MKISTINQEIQELTFKFNGEKSELENRIRELT